MTERVKLIPNKPLLHNVVSEVRESEATECTSLGTTRNGRKKQTSLALQNTLGKNEKWQEKQRSGSRERFGQNVSE